MIRLTFAKTTQGVEDGRGEGNARVLGSTIADPLARMQFEYRATTIPRRLFPDAHEAATLHLSPMDFVPDQAGPGAWAFSPAAAALSGPATMAASLPASAILESFPAVASLFDTVHHSWAA